MNFYNDNDKFVCRWLENLILFGHIPNGIVDSRPIQEITPHDLTGFTQCHFFAGIGGWSLALKLAGWPETRPVWTGSCPCQPFSVAGKQKGFSDSRDLWPDWFRLIKKCSPPILFSEQVASAADWLTRMRSDLGRMDYAVGTVPIQAASAGAAQFRDRYWVVADSINRRSQDRWTKNDAGNTAGVEKQSTDKTICSKAKEFCADGSLAANCFSRLEKLQSQSENPNPQLPPPQRTGLQCMVCSPRDGWGQGWTESEFRGRGFTAAVASLPDGTQFIKCPDGKYRRLPPPRVRWLGNGIPSRVARLRALGNSIYPPVAAQFIRAYMGCRP